MDRFRANRSGLLGITGLLLLAACSSEPTKTVYTASPEIVAVFAGQARGADLNLARACGADPKVVTARAAEEQPPTTLSPEAGIIYKAALNARAAEPAEKPPAEQCAALRKRQDFAVLFSSPAQRPGARRGAGTERRGNTAAAYCAEGTEAVLRDPTMTAGLKALRESCSPGDTVALPATAIGIIASACDLSKPVPVAGPSVFCTLSSVREIRPAPGSQPHSRHKPPRSVRG